ncbi:MAG: hypothetical protein MZV70_47105 [Desulfobacterales bacterium]|nr:hypothetical protein [Desulfobacterales bacterium]
MHETGARPATGYPVRDLHPGDFCGRSSRGVIEPLQGRKAVLIDRDTIDEVLGEDEREDVTGFGRHEPHRDLLPPG